MNSAQHILLGVVRLYRLTVSPAQRFLFGPLSGCRFTPTCSEYATGAIRSHGAITGTWLALKRIARCHPWGGCGYDPVPLPPQRQSESVSISFLPRLRSNHPSAAAGDGQHGS